MDEIVGMRAIKIIFNKLAKVKAGRKEPGVGPKVHSRLP